MHRCRETNSKTSSTSEYEATSLENILRAQKMGVKQLPSIYINGALAYESIIPSREALNNTIRKARD